MFMRSDRVGHFALTPDEFKRGDPRALFRLLVATTLFQRRQDQQVMRILRDMRPDRVAELSSVSGLQTLAETSPCDLLRNQAVLLGDCDLGKDANGEGTCGRRPHLDCHLKQHTVWLKRYGHFGKVPTSAALMLREVGAPDLGALYRRIVETKATRRERSEALENALRTSWRISEKIAAMFLSMLSNPDLGSTPPWRELDHSYFVAVDSNTDLYLKSVGYSGAGTYSARREFLWSLAERIDLRRLKPGLQSYNPRIVQQAAYLFMSATNRRHADVDCSRDRPSTCGACPTALQTRCPVVQSASA